MVRPAGVSDMFRTDFIDQVAEGGIGIDIDPPAEADTDFGRIVTSEDITVLDESDLEAEAGRSERRTDTGDTAADDNKIEMALIHRFFLTENRPAERPVLLKGISRDLIIAGQKKGITTAVKARQIVESGFMGPFPEEICSPSLPAPVGGNLAGRCTQTRTEGFPIRLSVEKDLETAGRLRLRPPACPILRPDIEGIISVLRNLKGRLGISLKRGSDPVRHQVTGAHLDDELLLYGPVPQIFEPGCEEH